MGFGDSSYWLKLGRRNYLLGACMKGGACKAVDTLTILGNLRTNPLIPGS